LGRKKEKRKRTQPRGGTICSGGGGVSEGKKKEAKRYRVLGHEKNEGRKGERQNCAAEDQQKKRVRKREKAKILGQKNEQMQDPNWTGKIVRRKRRRIGSTGGLKQRTLGQTNVKRVELWEGWRSFNSGKKRKKSRFRETEEPFRAYLRASGAQSHGPRGEARKSRTTQNIALRPLQKFWVVGHN